MTVLSRKLPVLIASALLLSLSAATVANAGGHRPDARVLSCATLGSLVQANGAVVISTGRYTYDRYVKNQAFCQRLETTKRAIISSADGRCNVGFLCVQVFKRF